MPRHMGVGRFDVGVARRPANPGFQNAWRQAHQAITYRSVVSAFVLCVLLEITAPGQFVIFISPRAGLVSHTEGHVMLGDATEGIELAHVSEGGRLMTREGRAEIVLSPYGVLRLDEHTEVELVSNDITDVRVRLISGSIIFDLAKDPGTRSVTLLCEKARIQLIGHGLYRADAADGTAALRGLQGRTWVSLNGTEQEVGSNHSIRLIAGFPAVKLGRSRDDRFETWNRDRARKIRKARRYGKKLARAERR